MSESNVYSLSLSNLLRPEVRANPYPFYARLRSQDPVHWDDSMGFWVLTRYDDVANAFNDPRFSRAKGLTAWHQRRPESEQAAAEPVYHAFSKMMTYADPPYHTRLRGLANKSFTPRMVEQMRSHIQRITDDLLDAVEPKGRMDVFRDLAYPLPIIVIAEMLGLPVEERQRFKEWSDDLFAVLGLVRRSPELMDKASRSLAEVTDYVTALSHDRRLLPREDLLTALVTVVDEAQRLTQAELVSNVVLILAAAHETTTNMITNGVLALLQNPGQMQKLRREPALASPAIEEILRYESPAQIVYRSVTEDVAIDGKHLGRGQLVNLILGAANRDPEQFSEPDQFDITRSEGKHVGFGLGIHFCLGASLARLEGQIAFTTLLGRIPNLRLETDALEWLEHPTFRGLKSLPVAF